MATYQLIASNHHIGRAAAANSNRYSRIISIMNPSDGEGHYIMRGSMKRPHDEIMCIVPSIPSPSSMTKKIKADGTNSRGDSFDSMAEIRMGASPKKPDAALRLLEKGSFQQQSISYQQQEMSNKQRSQHQAEAIVTSHVALREVPRTQNSLVPSTHQEEELLESEPSHYAIKFPANRSTPSSLYETDHRGRKMLAKELRLLCILRHEHITQLHHMSSAPSDELPFLVVDQIADETLEDKLTPESLWRSSLLRDNTTNDLRSRLAVVRSLASVIDYLHGKRIIYRGLEPSTIGFDAVTRKLKLFSFVSARELPAVAIDPSCCAAGCFQLTAMVGAPNYMAPENYLGEPYGPSADVYSFSIVAWEILSRKRAFGATPTGPSATAAIEGTNDDRSYVSNCSNRSIEQQQQRPDVDKGWPLLIRNILRFGWARRNATRPSMKAVVAALDQYLQGVAPPSPIAEYINVMLLSNGSFVEY